MSHKIEAIFFDLDQTLLEEENANKEAFRVTCSTAKRKYPNINIKRLYTSVEYHADRLWSQCVLFKYMDNIQVSFWEALCTGFPCNDHYSKQLKLWAPKYRQNTWAEALSDQNILDYDLAEKLSRQFIWERRSRFHTFPEVKNVLECLRKTSRLAIVTNGDPSLQREKIWNAGLDQYFEEVIVSGTLGVGKPDPMIFLYALSLFNLQPQNLLMVGDNLERDILGAQKTGIKGVWINRSRRPNKTAIQPDFEIASLTELELLLTI